MIKLTMQGNLTELNSIQIGAYGEQEAKRVFKINNYNTYTCDSDDHGIDFLAEAPDRSTSKIQVKTIRRTATNTLIIIKDDKIYDDPDMYVFVYLLDLENGSQHSYLIPAHDIISISDKKCFKDYRQKNREFDLSFNKNYIEDFAKYEIK